jgi:hypothetical protein
MKATMSSLSDRRLSVPIVKQSFSQIAPGQQRPNVESSPELSLASVQGLVDL